MACQDDMDNLAAAYREASARQSEQLHVARGCPGTRAPHMLLERNGKRLCTCLLFGEHFVLLAGVDATAWRDAALQMANRLGIRLVARCIGAGGDLVNVDGRWPVAYGVNSSGAVLVCPDGLVCWRAEERGEQLEQTLEAVLATWPDNTKGSAFGASAGVAPAENGEMSQNTVLAGLLSRDTQMRQFAGDIP